MYIVVKYKIHLYSLRNNPEKLAKGSLFCPFLKLVQINFIFTDNVRILYIYLQSLSMSCLFLFCRCSFSSCLGIIVFMSRCLGICQNIVHVIYSIHLNIYLRQNISSQNAHQLGWKLFIHDNISLLLARKPNLENFLFIQTNSFTIFTLICKSSFTCPELQASGLSHRP